MGDLDGWTYCPLCAAELRREDAKVECPDCGFATYANSKPTVSALVVDDEGRVMFSRRGVDPSAGKWDLPGGFLEEGEEPLDGLRRELEEEAGIRLHDFQFVGAFIDWYKAGPRSVATLNLYWSARIAEGTPEPADDVAEFRFFAADDVPEAELAFPHIPKVLSAWRGRNEHA